MSRMITVAAAATVLLASTKAANGQLAPLPPEPASQPAYYQPGAYGQPVAYGQPMAYGRPAAYGQGVARQVMPSPPPQARFAARPQAPTRQAPGGVNWESYLPQTQHVASADCGCNGPATPGYVAGPAMSPGADYSAAAPGPTYGSEVAHGAGPVHGSEVAAGAAYGSPANCGGGGYGAYGDAAAYGGVSYGSCDGAGAGCGEYGCIQSCVAPRTIFWNASIGALFLTREEQDSYTFSYDSANEADQYVDAQDADMDFSTGIEASIGRFDCCTNIGWQLSYWQLFPDAETTSMTGAALAPGFLDGIRNYDQLNYNGGTADANVNNAQIHRLTRDWDVYNVEANRLRLFSNANACGGSPWQFQSLCGFRYFKFKESLLFVSDPSETMIDGDLDEYNIDIRTDNNLYGLQLGGITERCTSRRLSFRLLAKAGVFANDAEMDYFEGGAAGAATINNGPNAGQLMRVHAEKTDFSFLGEFGAGVTYRLGCYWRIGADYRVLGVTGLALPTDQIYHDTRGINDVRELDNDGSLLLHGAFVRAERCF